MRALLELATSWERDADRFAEYGDGRGATTCRLHAGELRAAVQETLDQELSLSEAAKESGYSNRRLRELVASGSIPNAGRRGAPRIRRGDLPRKVGPPSGSFNPAQEARDILGRK